jgi:protein-L-isoaspartate O-methyltransferase
LDRDYFEKLYTESPDPWDFATSEYEQRKYEQTLEVLGGRRFPQALEVGSSIGVFTGMLAPYCDKLLALDTSERAVEIARERLSDYKHVRVERRTIPEETPEGPFDLIVASEVLYGTPKPPPRRGNTGTRWHAARRPLAQGDPYLPDAGR